MNRTKIPYADFTWNPTLGCSRVSPGCENCYAERLASTRLRHLPAYEGLTCDGRWTGKVRLLPERLGEPTELRQGWTIFVGDMSDIFHPEVPFEFIAAIFGVMAACPQHRFLVLTKRPEIMAKWFEWIDHRPGNRPGTSAIECQFQAQGYFTHIEDDWEDPHLVTSPVWPLPNVILGATAEDQHRFNDRVKSLKQCPSVKYWLSLEPLLGPIDILEPCPSCCPPQGRQETFWECGSLGPSCPDCSNLGGFCPVDQVVVGGESGPKARQCNVDWIQAMRSNRHASVRQTAWGMLRRRKERHRWLPGQTASRAWKAPQAAQEPVWLRRVRMARRPSS